jgi:hypothetical protein
VECRDERRTKKTPGLERWATGGLWVRKKRLEGGVGPFNSNFSRFCKDKRNKDRRKFERFENKFKQFEFRKAYSCWKQDFQHKSKYFNYCSLELNLEQRI